MKGTPGRVHRWGTVAEVSYPEHPAAPAEKLAAASVPAPGDVRAPLSATFLGLLRKGGGPFLVVGVIGFLVDAGTYNLLVFWIDGGVMRHAPLPAKIISIALATVVTYFGNKWWTFGHKQSGNPVREYLLYALFNAIAIGLQLGCLGFSRYVLDLASPLADNISGTLIGQAVAMIFRYWAYDTFVFTGAAEAEAEQQAEATGR
ncbi:GtrA family protein [Nocardia farcinica]|nr:GtrA family protein [Nocardia farcinica]MBF6283085.1 GtrA family protein [Nocardia farcinica]MBF6306911.1 GtrA family protein [Nocardia farcinica]MBF6391336.1 GtrA family protein [Nocardia farcinica]MBF6490140.1 GtrA family protein [Nocardia farcinica]